jgi:hypothetical protein
MEGPVFSLVFGFLALGLLRLMKQSFALGLAKEETWPRQLYHSELTASRPIAFNVAEFRCWCRRDLSSSSR